MSWYTQENFMVDELTLMELINHIEGINVSPNPTMKRLCEHPNFLILLENSNLRSKLKQLLDVEIQIIKQKVKNKKISPDLILKRDHLWQEYELLRRLYCWNNKSIIIHKKN